MREPRVDGAIKVSEVRLIDEDGSQLGIVSTKYAIDRAREKELNLVEVAPEAKPPVCKLMNYGAYKFKLKKKLQEEKKKNKTQDVKTIKLRPVIDTHDLEVKIRNANKFLSRGDKVNIIMQFRGREMAYMEKGHEIIKEFLNSLEPHIVDSPVATDGNRISVSISPNKS